MNYINKDTEIYGSFSKNPGNNGCKTFNVCFSYYDINAIYKSFYVNDIIDGVNSAKTLNFSGFAISMPFKKEVLNYVDEMDDVVKKIGAANTVKIDNGKLIAYNTDYLAIKDFINELNINSIIIIGDGGFASAVRCACDDLNVNHFTINRKNWNMIGSINNEVVFNCTPVDININKNNTFYDLRPSKTFGKKIAIKQAKYQFEIYTNKKFPLDIK